MLTDPIARLCINCGTAVTPLLTIDSDECRDHRRSWGPNEEQHIPEFDVHVCSTCYTDTDLIQ
ncbi:hypothetical protein [Streptomyces sp. NPDC058401]|uniref:hypothetical protein n=1 Tax=Streptomyces sp. NPDC058401 TaxID=3346480 RepID=UPI00365890E2